MQLETIIKKEDLAKLSKDSIKSINEAISKSISSEVSNVEAKLNEKFSEMTSNLTNKFHGYVSKSINESVNVNIADKVNTKMAKLIQDVATLLESHNIPVTEKTLELEKKLKSASKDLVDANTKREEIKELLSKEQKNVFIYQKLAGMKPEIIAAAIDRFSGSDILEVEEEIDEFLAGDLSSIVINGGGDISDFDDSSLDKVKDALDEIDSSESNRNLKKETFQFENADYSKLSKGLAPVRVKSSPSPQISTEDLKESENVMVESTMDDGFPVDTSLDPDTQETLNKINDMNNFGFSFRGYPK